MSKLRSGSSFHKTGPFLRMKGVSKPLFATILGVSLLNSPMVCAAPPLIINGAKDLNNYVEYDKSLNSQEFSSKEFSSFLIQKNNNENYSPIKEHEQTWNRLTIKYDDDTELSKIFEILDDYIKGDCLASVKKVSLSSCGLTDIPGFIFSLKGIEFLDISGNKIQELPAKIGCLENLKVLDLSSNGALKKIPRSLIGLKDRSDSLKINIGNCPQIPQTGETERTLGRKELEILFFGREYTQNLIRSYMIFPNSEALSALSDPINYLDKIFSRAEIASLAKNLLKGLKNTLQSDALSSKNEESNDVEGGKPMFSDPSMADKAAKSLDSLLKRWSEDTPNLLNFLANLARKKTSPLFPLIDRDPENKSLAVVIESCEDQPEIIKFLKICFYESLNSCGKGGKKKEPPQISKQMANFLKS